jgi:hypothetical protein
MMIARLSSSSNLAVVNISCLRFDAYRSQHPAQPSAIVELSRSVFRLPLLQSFIAQDVMRSHQHSSCAAAFSDILALLMSRPSMPHARLELLDFSRNGDAPVPLFANLFNTFSGISLSPRMFTMLACVEYLYHGRVTAGYDRILTASSI